MHARLSGFRARSLTLVVVVLVVVDGGKWCAGKCWGVWWGVARLGAITVDLISFWNTLVTAQVFVGQQHSPCYISASAGAGKKYKVGLQNMTCLGNVKSCVFFTTAEASTYGFYGGESAS